MLYHQVSKQAEDRICEGIFIGRTDVSGMDKKQAQTAVDKQAEVYGKQKIFLSVEGKKLEVTLEEMGFDISKEEKLIEEAIDYGKKGNVFSRYAEIRNLKKNKKMLQPVYQIRKRKRRKFLKRKRRIVCRRR